MIFRKSNWRGGNDSSIFSFCIGSTRTGTHSESDSGDYQSAESYSCDETDIVYSSVSATEDGIYSDSVGLSSPQPEEYT